MQRENCAAKQDRVFRERILSSSERTLCRIQNRDYCFQQAGTRYADKTELLPKGKNSRF